MMATSNTTWAERTNVVLRHCQQVSRTIEASERPSPRARLMVEHAFRALALAATKDTAVERATLLMQSRAYAGAALALTLPRAA